MQFTRESVVNLSAVTPIADWIPDICLIPPGRTPAVLSQALKDMPGGKAPMSILDYGALQMLYGDAIESGEGEPAFVSLFPAILQGDLRRHACLMHADREWIWNMPGWQYTSLSYSIDQSGLIDGLVKAFPLHRLGDIKQLGFIHQPPAARLGMEALANRFSHDRLMHSIDVAVLTAIIIANNDTAFTDQECRNAVAAALLHDGRTPAGGDTTKLLSPKVFDEDAKFSSLLDRNDWSRLQRDYGLDRQLLIDIVQEKNLLGRIKDLADKIAYVSRDTFQLLMATRVVTPGQRDQVYDDVQDLVEQHPFFGDLWETAMVADGELVLSDASRLGDFLRLRALLFRNLYLNPQSRYPQFIAAEMCMRAMYEDGILTAQNLLEMGDTELMRLMSAWLGISWQELCINGPGEMDTEIFADLETAKRRQAELQNDGVAFTVIEDMRQGASAATGFLVATQTGPQPFRQACAQQAAEIESICQDARSVRLYLLRNPAPELRDRLESRNNTTRRVRRPKP